MQASRTPTHHIIKTETNMSSGIRVGGGTSRSETTLGHRDHSNAEMDLEARSQRRAWADVVAGRLGQTTRSEWIHEGLNGEIFDEFKEDLEESDDDDEYEDPLRHRRQHSAQSSEIRASAQGFPPSAADLPALGGSRRVPARIPEIVVHHERRASFYERLFRIYRRSGMTISDSNRSMIVHCHFVAFSMDFDPWVIELLADYVQYLRAEQGEVHLDMPLHDVSENDVGAVEIEAPYQIRWPMYDPEQIENEVGEESVHSKPSANVALGFGLSWQGDFWIDADARTVGRHKLALSRSILI
jgi:hypothetical protein